MLDHMDESWIYCGHLHFIDFQNYNYSFKHVYINIIRDPIERLASFYYYRRDGRFYVQQAFRPLFSSLSNDSVSERKNMSFDDCVMKQDIECHDWRFVFQIIPFFCGQDPMCIYPSEKALAQAKRNLQKHFAVVGYLEKYQEFLEILEYMFPLYFSNARILYRKMTAGLINVIHKTNNSKPILHKTKEILLHHQDIQLEYNFYKFVT